MKQQHLPQNSKPHFSEEVVSVSIKELSYALIEALYIGKHSACLNISDIAAQLQSGVEKRDEAGDLTMSEDFKRGYNDALGFLKCYSQDYSQRSLNNAPDVADFLIQRLENGEFSEELLQ